ncbi:MAG: SPFH domain-containing protein [Phycisphaerales bacterium]
MPDKNTPDNNMPDNDHNLDDLISGQEPTTPQVPEPSYRAASVRLRGVEANAVAADQARMDTANQSLAEALKITYNLLRFGMVVLLILFAASGIQTIKEGERGIKVKLGKQVQTNLEPGPQWAWPYPFGEIVRVGEGAVEIAVAKEFMPNIPGDHSDDAALSVDINRFKKTGKLDPATDGSNITSDFNIAHTQWSVNYRRTDHSLYVSNIIPEQERSIMKAIVQRAVVQVIGGITIDDLLKNSSETISGRVRSLAQASLDQLESGITIDRVVLVRKNAALSLRDQFNSVQTAAQKAGKAREDALLLRDQMLNEVAGRASDVLINEINEYERLIELQLDDEAETKLARIDAILEGRPVEIDGEMVGALVSGEISEILTSASSYASNRVSQAIAQLENFNAKLAQYEANPRLMVARDRANAMSEFLARDFVSSFILPEGVSLEVLINNDPDIARELDRMRKRREAEESLELRREDMRREWYRTQRGLKEPEEQ